MKLPGNHTRRRAKPTANLRQNQRELRYQAIWYGGQPPPLWMRMAEHLFAGLTGFRRQLYRWGVLKTHRMRVPVIIVGNITVGGTGKTPFVIWLVEQLRQKGYQPGVVSRGYGGVRKVEPMLVTPNSNVHASGDEALLIARRTGVPVMVGGKRVQAVRKLLSEHPVNVIVADDGLQHYALGRDVEIALVDGQRRFGNGHLLPAGPLREPVQRLRNVDMIICKGRCDDGHYFEPVLGEAWNLAQPSLRRPLSAFTSQSVNALAGIARPEHFFRLLAEQGIAIYKWPKPDHYQLEPEDFRLGNAYPILITEKDAVKIQSLSGEWKKDIWVVPMTLRISDRARKAIWQCLNTRFKNKLPMAAKGNAA